MFHQIRRLGADTAIYGVSTILGRFLNFLLVPFYTNVLEPGDYGIVAYVYSLLAFVTVIYSYGMETAYFKYSSTLEIGSEKENFSTPFLSLLGSSVVFSAIIVILASPVSGAIHLPEAYDRVILYAAGILALDAVAIIPFASLRMEHKAGRFAAIKFLNILINVVMNILLLVVFRTGVEGIFISGLVASFLTLVLLAPTILRHFSIGFNRDLFRSLLKFGLPIIPSGLAAMAVQVIDRPILRALTNDATVGIYQANYRLGIFMMLIVSMYDYAWRPFYFSVAKEANAKEIFARVLTYLVLFMSAIFLALTFYIGDIARLSFFGHHLIHPDYWSGLAIVPVVLLGYVFLGISTNMSAGIYIEKKTQLLPVVTFAGAITNVIVNYLLIPPSGMLGAAWATCLAYFIMAAIVYVMARRVYPVRYELGRIAKIAAAGAIVYVLYLMMESRLDLSGWVLLGAKFALLALFIVLVYVMGFFEKSELAGIRGLLKLGTRSVPPSSGAPPDDTNL